MSSPLFTSEGEAALTLAAAQPDPTSVAAAATMRREFRADLATAALAQETLRRRAVAKCGPLSRSMLFTRDGLEQATRLAVAQWRAGRLVESGITRIVDLGCGIGADSMAMAQAGIQVTAVERDPDTAAIAAHNLALINGSAEVLTGDAVALSPKLVDDAGTAVFLDPARRTTRGRSWRLTDLTPPWSFVLELLDRGVPTVVKLGPGVDRSALPAVPVTHVSHTGDAVETTLWVGIGELPANEATIITADGAVHSLRGRPGMLPVGPLGRYLHEPDPAVSRAQLVGGLGSDLVQLDEHAGYFSSDHLLALPYATSFEVLEVLDPRPKSLARWVREHDIGTLEIKKRGRGGALDLDPAALRRTLCPRGAQSATLVLCRVEGEVRAASVRRVPVT